MRSVLPTAWVPQSKPIWFTELGCGAVDKGANQPNIFGDGKSSEDGAPHFSSGAPDPLMQRQFLRAELGYWMPGSPAFEAANNPLSAIYGGRMLDPDRIYLWTWDARPYPAFPEDVATWADGPNHASGHWLTGRLGAVASDELAHAVARDFGIEVGAVEVAPPMIHGMVAEGVATARDALAPMLAATRLAIRETGDGLAVARGRERKAADIAANDLVRADRPVVTRRRPDPSEAVGQVALGYGDRARNYLGGTATAMRLEGGLVAAESTSLVLDPAGARIAAEAVLRDRLAGSATLEMTLPPSRLALEAGDTISLEGQGDGPFEITEIRDGDTRQISARTIAPPVVAGFRAERPGLGADWPPPRAIPEFAVLHLPPVPDAPEQSRLALAAFAEPWPGEVRLRHDATGATVARASRPAHLGALVADLDAGPVHYWDRINRIDLVLHSGHLSAADDDLVLAGANRLAVETSAGWEVVGFAEAELLSPRTYRLGRLLRGQAGTGHAVAPAPTGARVVVLDERVAEARVPGHWLGETIALRSLAGRSDGTGTPIPVVVGVDPLLPLRPAHARAARVAGSDDIGLRWTRRSRADADGWGVADASLDNAPEAYRVTIFDGSTAVRTIAASGPSATYTAAQQAADFGGPATAFAFTVAQVSTALGAGHPAHGEFNA